MSKKLGFILAFIGGYITMIGGLVWVMHFNTPELQELYKPYDWAWGLLCAIGIIAGAVISAKGYILGLIGLGVELLGIGGGIATIIYGVTVENYTPTVVIIGVALAALGFGITLVFHVLEMIKIKKNGYSMLK